MPQSHANDQQRYLTVLQNCRDMALVDLESRMSEMFSNVEPALLDFIDKADTNQGQFQFIDAISVIQAKRKDVELRFREEISRGFTEFTKGQSISYPFPLLESQHEARDSLELLDDDELDQRLSLQTMIDKTDGRSFQQLYGLKQRLAMTHGGRKVEESDIPGGPIHIVSAFQIAAIEFDFESNLLLIMYALFEKFVMRRLDELYEGFNKLLVEAGIFPNLKFEAPKIPKSQQDAGDHAEEMPAAETEETDYTPPQGAAAPGGRPGAAGGGQNRQQSGEASAAAPHEPGTPNAVLGEELFNSIRDLMSARRTQDPVYAQHPDVNSEASGTRPMVDTPSLVSAIGDIQPSQSASYLPRVGKNGERPASAKLNDGKLDEIRERLIEEREKLFGNVDRNTIPSADLDTIELVGMLFEHVLNEEDLPNIAKALISHLHTPYLKVAILDHHFLIDSRHVARQLLNQMVDAGRLWIEESSLRRGIYYPMQEGINRILSEFKDDIRVFEEVHEKLTRQIQELEQKAKVVETRTKEAARGRERLENARMRAHRIVQDRIANHNFHPVVERFLTHAWLDKMILMLLRDPDIENSNEWKRVLSVIDDIVWIYESRNHPELEAKARNRLPGLQQRIEDGLTSMGDFHQPDLHALFDQLTVYAMGGTETSEVHIRPLVQAPPPARAGKQAEATTTKRPEKPLSAEEKQIAESLKKLKFGTWFELEADDGELHQLKLSWYSPVTHKYMFVDKTGVQALVTPIGILTRQIMKGRARILKQPTLPFVDRALDTVLGILQQAFK